MDQVQQLLDSLAPLESELRNFLSEVLTPIEFKKGDFIVKEGSVARYLGFIGKGVVRGYHFDDAGHEFTSWFMKEGDVYAAVKSFFTQTRSN